MKCPYCGGGARLVGGDAIYRNRPDLASKFFWLCSPCNAYVGCHPVGDGKKPLGRLANAELRREKSRTHELVDPYWKEGIMSRKQVYARLAELMGLTKKDCHIGMFDVEQCKKAQAIAIDFEKFKGIL